MIVWQMLLPLWLMVLPFVMIDVIFCGRCYCLCNTSWLEQVVLALWYNVPTTLYFDGIVWWLSNCKYKSVCLGFLSTEVWRASSSLGVIRIPKNGMVPSVMENFMLGLMEFKCSRKLFLSCFLMIVSVSCTYLFQSTGVEGDVLMAWTSRSSINRLATMGLMGDNIAAPSACS